jgi:twitching motility protein PilJ
MFSEADDIELTAFSFNGGGQAEPSSPTPSPVAEPKVLGNIRRQVRGLSLKTKATALAIAIGIIPLTLVGGAAAYFANQSITKQISDAKLARASGMGDQVNRFMIERFGDIKTYANLPILADPKVRAVVTDGERTATLARLLKAHPYYDSIAVYTLEGDLLLEAGPTKVLQNASKRDYFQQALNRNLPYISQPEASTVTGKTSIFFAAPVKDLVSGETIAIVLTRMPVESIKPAIERFARGNDEYHLLDASGKILIAKNPQETKSKATEIFPGLSAVISTRKEGAAITPYRLNNNIEQLAAYALAPKLEGLPDLGWSGIIALNTQYAFEPQRQLLLTLAIGTLLAAAAVGAAATILTGRATRPILEAANAAEKLGQGELETRIAVVGNDELALLGENINNMAGQIQTLLDEQEEAARQQFASQEEVARQQMKRAEEQRQQKEFLQRRALELLMEVDPISRGDLTIRAKVTEDEIGTIADSYNATILSLRKIVSQVKDAVGQVATTTTSSEASVQTLSAEAVRQTEEISTALNRIEEMSQSIRQVAANAAKAEAAVQEANQTVEAGDDAMNRTVEGIMAIRETVAETSKKVKRLGESSQKISKVVNLIGTFAAQTNLLALNASIEAARAGEEGRGFAVVADEVRSLARQSAEATADIEKLVAEIQMETNEVVTAMEAGTEQVVVGTKLVDETRQSLNKIAAVSTQINELVGAIAQAASTQSQASEVVTQTMSDVAMIATKTSAEATQVSVSINELLTVAQELQSSVGQFKL